jgi:hypothetical protein
VSRIGTTLKTLAAVATMGAAIAAAAQASAAEIYIHSSSMNNPATVNISGPGLNENAYSAPISFVVNDGPTATNNTYDILAFCVDIFHNITLGNLGYVYHVQPITTDSATPADTLTQLQLNKISSLVNFGTALYNTGDADLSNKLAAVQGAIWEIENPDYDVTGSTVINDYISLYESEAATILPVGSMHGIYQNDFSHQGFAIAGGVPEPATWLMMIMGVGGVGAMMRRRQKIAAAIG